MAKYPEFIEGQKIMTWYVYIAKSKLGYYYVGISPDPDKRMVKHNTGNGAKMAIQQGPFTLVYKSEPFANKSIARKREVQIKKWGRIKKEKLIVGEWW